MVIKVTLLAEEWTQGGSLSVLNRQLGIHLAQHPDVEVSLLIPKFSPEDRQDAEKYNIKVVEPEKLPGFDAVSTLGFPPKGFSAHFVISHNVKLGSQGYVMRGNIGCKWIHMVHTNVEEMGMFKTISGAISTAPKEHEKQLKLCEIADMVVAIGSKLKDSLSYSLRFSGKEIYDLTPGIFDEFCDIRKKFPENSKFNVLIFGRGDEEDFELKGFDVAAKALADLNDKTYHLIIVGAPDGKQEQLATKLLSHGLYLSQLIVRRFCKDREELANLFYEADLLIMPSAPETFGLVALEALSAALPILVTSNSGLAEALRKVPGGSQCIVDPEDDWAKKIKDNRKYLIIRLEEAEMLREMYKEKYSWREKCDALVRKMISMCPERAENAQGDSVFTPENSPPTKQVKAVKAGIPSRGELLKLASEIPVEWKSLGQLLGIHDELITLLESENQYDLTEQAYTMLVHWLVRNAGDATYKVLYEALSDERVNRGDLAEKLSIVEKGKKLSSSSLMET